MGRWAERKGVWRDAGDGNPHLQHAGLRLKIAEELWLAASNQHSFLFFEVSWVYLGRTRKRKGVNMREEYFILDNKFLHVPDLYPKEQRLIMGMCSHIDFK